MARLTPEETLGFDPTKHPYVLLSKKMNAIRKCVGENEAALDAIDELDELVNRMDDANAFVRWTKIDENDRSTWPTAYEPCLALVSWSKGKSYRHGTMGGGEDASHEAVFYEACYGFYCRKRDLMNFPDDDESNEGDELVFVLDHCEQDYNDAESWVDLPQWWAKIATPQTLEMEWPNPKDGA